MQMKRLDDPNMTQSKTGPQISHIKKKISNFTTSTSGTKIRRKTQENNPT